MVWLYVFNTKKENTGNLVAGILQRNRHSGVIYQALHPFGESPNPRSWKYYTDYELGDDVLKEFGHSKPGMAGFTRVEVERRPHMEPKEEATIINF